MSLFVDGNIADLGLSRSAVSAAYTAATVLGALSLPYIGRWIDRVGGRDHIGAIKGFAKTVFVGGTAAGR